jgi:hypothetical protein
MRQILVTAILVLQIGCSSMKSIESRTNYANPDWYATCAQSGKGGYFWWAKEYAYACGAGESLYAQAAEEQMYAIAINNFAKRINSEVNSETEIIFVNDAKSAKTRISYSVKNTALREHSKLENGHFTMNGRHYTFVRLGMPKATFDQLIREAKSSKQ